MTNICDIIYGNENTHKCLKLIPKEYDNCINIINEFYSCVHTDENIKLLYNAVKVLIKFLKYERECNHCIIELYDFLVTILNDMHEPYKGFNKRCNDLTIDEINKLYEKFNDDYNKHKIFKHNIQQINNETLNTFLTVENFNEEYVMNDDCLKEIYVRECKKLNLL